MVSNIMNQATTKLPYVYEQGIDKDHFVEFDICYVPLNARVARVFGR